jgi:FkbM family methyltransferase
MDPEPRPPALPSWAGSLRGWYAGAKAERLLRRGEPKRALAVIERHGLSDPALRVRALLGAGRPGAARRELKAAANDLGSQLGREVEAAEAAALDALLASGSEPLVPRRLLGRMPRYLPGQFEARGVRLAFPDGPSADSAYREIFERRAYEIPPAPAPRIIDGGANIGLAALYFFWEYPGARITCFEAAPEICRYLRRNLESAGASGTEVVEAALWETDGRIQFTADGSDAGRVAATGEPVPGRGRDRPTTVAAVRLSPYLSEPVDLLKLDIEGAELAVLRECQDALDQVSRVFVEYHSFENQPQVLDEILAILRRAGFRLAVTVTDQLSPRPFVQPGSNLGMDMRLNLYGSRTGTP